MKHSLFICFFLLGFLLQSFHVSPIVEKPCEILQFNSGKHLAVRIIKQKNGKIYYSHCSEDSGRERSVRKKLIKKVIRFESQKDYEAFKQKGIENYQKNPKNTSKNDNWLKALVISAGAIAAIIVGILIIFYILVVLFIFFLWGLFIM